MIADKNDLFSARLETEKESFSKQLQLYTSNFEKIKEFKSLDNSQEFNLESFELRRDLDKAHA